MSSEDGLARREGIFPLPATGKMASSSQHLSSSHRRDCESSVKRQKYEMCETITGVMRQLLMENLG